MMSPFLELGPEKNSHTKKERFSRDWWTVGRSGKTALDQEVEDIEKGGIPQPARTFELVYSSHLIEHLIHPRYFLEECLRVLKPGGVCRVNAPSARWYADQYLTGRIDVDDMVEQLRSYDQKLHKGGWDDTKLIALMREVGFEDVAPFDPCQSLDERLTDQYFSVRPFRSIRVEGRKTR